MNTVNITIDLACKLIDEQFCKYARSLATNAAQTYDW